MFTVVPSVDSRPAQPRGNASLGYAYATLGLRAGEARVDAIRQAAQLSAAKIHQVAQDHDELASLLSDVATSTYRLLDPRRRPRKVERIQLCILSELGWEFQQRARRPLLPGVHRGSPRRRSA